MHRLAILIVATGFGGVLADCGPTRKPIESVGVSSAGVVSESARDSGVAPVRAAVAQAWADHLAAAKRGDAVAVSAIYTEDVVYAVGGAPEVRGRPAIDSLEARGLRAVKVLDAAHTTHALRRAGDVAYELGSVVGPILPAGDTARVVAFHFMAQWRRASDGRWRVTYLVGQ